MSSFLHEDPKGVSSDPIITISMGRPFRCVRLRLRSKPDKDKIKRNFGLKSFDSLENHPLFLKNEDQIESVADVGAHAGKYCLGSKHRHSF